MTSLWLDPQNMTVRKYSATSTGTKAVVRIEIEVTDPSALGFLLKDIGEAQRSIARKREDAAAEAREQKRRKPLAITHLKGGEL